MFSAIVLSGSNESYEFNRLAVFVTSRGSVVSVKDETSAKEAQTVKTSTECRS